MEGDRLVRCLTQQKKAPNKANMRSAGSFHLSKGTQKILSIFPVFMSKGIFLSSTSNGTNRASIGSRN